MRRPAEMQRWGAGARDLCTGSTAGRRTAFRLCRRHCAECRTCRGREAGTSGRKPLVPRLDGPPAKPVERCAAARHGGGPGGCSGRNGHGRPHPSLHPPPECVPRGRAFPCAGRQRDARLHPLRKCAGPVPTETQKTAQLCQLPPECSAAGRDGGAAGGSDRLHAVRPPGRGSRVDQRAGRLGLRPGGCADLPRRGGCADDRRQQLRGLRHRV